MAFIWVALLLSAYASGRADFQAAYVEMLPFVVIHFDKPFLEALSSVVGGVVLGRLALRTHSFWYGALAHPVLAIGMEAMVTARVGFR